jgi:hypothetical protein
MAAWCALNTVYVTACAAVQNSCICKSLLQKASELCISVWAYKLSPQDSCCGDISQFMHVTGCRNQYCIETRFKLRPYSAVCLRQRLLHGALHGSGAAHGAQHSDVACCSVTTLFCCYLHTAVPHDLHAWLRRLHLGVCSAVTLLGSPVCFKYTGRGRSGILAQPQAVFSSSCSHVSYTTRRAIRQESHLASQKKSLHSLVDW